MKNTILSLIHHLKDEPLDKRISDINDIRKALHFMYYNFGRIHKTLRVTPAMEAGISTKVWTLEDIAALVVEPEAKPRGPYKKKA